MFSFIRPRPDYLSCFLSTFFSPPQRCFVNRGFLLECCPQWSTSCNVLHAVRSVTVKPISRNNPCVRVRTAYLSTFRRQAVQTSCEVQHHVLMIPTVSPVVGSGSVCSSSCDATEYSTRHNPNTTNAVVLLNLTNR